MAGDEKGGNACANNLCCCGGLAVWGITTIIHSLTTIPWHFNGDGNFIPLTGQPHASTGQPCVGNCTDGYCPALVPLAEYPSSDDGRYDWITSRQFPVTRDFMLRLPAQDGWNALRMDYNIFSTGISVAGPDYEFDTMRWTSTPPDAILWHAVPVLERSAVPRGAFQLHIKDRGLSSFSAIACHDDGSAVVSAQARSILFTTDYLAPEEVFEFAADDERIWTREHDPINHSWALFKNFVTKKYLSYGVGGVICSNTSDVSTRTWEIIVPSGQDDDENVPEHLGVEMKECAEPGLTVSGHNCRGTRELGGSCQFWSSRPTFAASFFPDNVRLAWYAMAEQRSWERYHSHPLAHSNWPDFRSAWCVSETGVTESCVPAEVEKHPSWSSACDSGACTPYPADGPWSDAAFEDLSGYTGCVRPSKSTRLDPRPFCLCEEGVKSCDDKCSGKTCPFADDCVAGSCSGCDEGWQGKNCDDPIGRHATCAELQLLGMDYEWLRFWMEVLFSPTRVACLCLILCIPLFFIVKFLGALYYNILWCAGPIPPCCGPCDIPNPIYISTMAEQSCQGCLTGTFHLAITLAATMVGFIILPFTLLATIFATPVLVFLKRGHMERSILFCFGGISFTYPVLGAGILLALPGYFIFKRLKTVHWLMEAKYWGSFSGSVYSHLWAYLLLPEATRSTSIGTATWMTCYFSIISLALGFCISLWVFPKSRKNPEDPLPLPPSDILDHDETSQTLKRMCTITIFLKALLADAPATAVPFLAFFSGGKALSEFNVYSSLASMAGLLDTLYSTARKAKGTNTQKYVRRSGSIAESTEPLLEAPETCVMIA